MAALLSSPTPAPTATTTVRCASNVPAEEPKKKAQSIIDSLPGNNLLSKTAILSSAAGVSVYAISNEYYVFNEETVVAFCLLCIWGGIFKYGGPMYKQWAEAQTAKIRDVLTEARADHTQAVKDRIVDVTKTLFEVSKVRFFFPFSFGFSTGRSRRLLRLLLLLAPPTLPPRHLSDDGFESTTQEMNHQRRR